MKIQNNLRQLKNKKMLMILSMIKENKKKLD